MGVNGGGWGMGGGMSCKANSSVKHSISDSTKLKKNSYDTFDISAKIDSVCEIVENLVGKGENAGTSIFSFFPQCFQKPSSSAGSLYCLLRVNQLPDDKFSDWPKLKQIADDYLQCI